MKASRLFCLSGNFIVRGILVAILLALVILNAGAITLTGSNGRAAELLGIKDATPKGLTAQTVADGPVIGIPWAKLDLEALERDQKLIFAAYERAVAGETVPLDLGSFAKDQPVTDGKIKRSKYMGWSDTVVGGKTFALQMPLGEPRGILLLAVGDLGGSMQNLGGRDRGEGPWAEFQTKYGLAILSYDFKMDSLDPTVMDSFAFAEKGSGTQVMTAIANFAKEMNKPEMYDLPIAVCGMDRFGSAFAYHFALWKPEIILGGVFSKGGFYNAEPSPEAAALPMAFIWGEYTNNHQLWHNENSAEHILKKYASMTPNWMGAIEFRGDGELSQFSDHFTRICLKAILDKRLPERKAKPEPEPKPEAEEAGDSKEGKKTAEGEEDEEMEEEKDPLVLPFDRSGGMVGNYKTGEVLKITDPEAALSEDETFILTSELARPWKQFRSGELEVSGQ
ncbi:MAG: hypothetical protein P1U86_10230 [Verrucomicrobiales bacterium]|nr:hypothetical protein [Verrucomicrobiales bacterium]